MIAQKGCHAEKNKDLLPPDLLGLSYRGQVWWNVLKGRAAMQPVA